MRIRPSRHFAGAGAFEEGVAMYASQLIVLSIAVLLVAAIVTPLIWAAVLDGRYHARHGCADPLAHPHV